MTDILIITTCNVIKHEFSIETWIQITMIRIRLLKIAIEAAINVNILSLCEYLKNN